MDGGFTIFGFSQSAASDVVHLDNTTGDLYLENPGEIEQYNQVFDRLRSAALEPADSIGLLDRLARATLSSGGFADGDLRCEGAERAVPGIEVVRPFHAESEAWFPSSMKELLTSSAVGRGSPPDWSSGNSPGRPDLGPFLLLASLVLL
jgi:hypothetical protein